MKNIRSLIMWGVIILALFLLFGVFQDSQRHAAEGQMVAYSDFLANAGAGRVTDIMIKGQDIKGHLSGGQEFHTFMPENENVIDRLKGSSVHIAAGKEDPEPMSAFSIFMYFAPFLLMGVIYFVVLRYMQGKGGAGGAMGFGKSRARMLTEAHGRMTFDDVAGIEEAKTDLQEVVEFLKDPQKFQRLGGKIPKGALLIGSPGTGKTLIARAVAGEANVPFFTISGSDFVEMFVGVGASRVRDMFEQAKKNAPCIIFIDEIDAVGRHRGAGVGGGNDEREQTLNQLLVEMDGFEANEGIIIIAATNRPDVLDTALLRPGRFDRQIMIPLPDIRGREKILSVHVRKVPLAKTVDLPVLARGTPGFSGAELANLVNEAALLAARRGKRVVGMDEFEHAKDKVMMGAERLSMAMSEDEKKNTAYHESGHAIVALHEVESDPIHKATIVPRGRALGMVVRLPEGDRYSTSFAKLKANLSVGMGGRVAEELIFGIDKVTTGASGDIQQVTNIARRMVTEWGMSDEIGMVDYAEADHDYRTKRISSATSSSIEKEVRKLIDDAYQRAKSILTEHMDELHKLAKALLEYELLSGEEIKALLRGEAIIRDTGSEDESENRPRASVPSSVVGIDIGGGIPQGA